MFKTVVTSCQHYCLNIYIGNAMFCFVSVNEVNNFEREKTFFIPEPNLNINEGENEKTDHSDDKAKIENPTTRNDIDGKNNSNSKKTNNKKESSGSQKSKACVLQ